MLQLCPSQELSHVKKGVISMPEITVCENPNILNENARSFTERQQELQTVNALENEQIERKKKSRYSDFAQLNRRNIIHLIKASQVNPTALSVLLFFIEHMNKMNAIVCSYRVLQEQLELSESTIKRSIRYLKENGFIAIYKSGTSNVYVVNDDLVWTCEGNKAKYCQFPANVILSASEQDEIDKNQKLKFDFAKIAKE